MKPDSDQQITFQPVQAIMYKVASACLGIEPVRSGNSAGVSTERQAQLALEKARMHQALFAEPGPAAAPYLAHFCSHLTDISAILSGG